MRDLLTMRVRIPSEASADVRQRIGLALVEAAIDRILAAQMRDFERSLVDNHAPDEALADLLRSAYERMQEWRTQTLQDARTWSWAWDDDERIH